MNALRAIHAALRPNGLLLDIRPAPRHPAVEIQRGATITPIGQFDESYCIGTLLVADAPLQSEVAAGRFARERDLTFPFIYHFDSVASWLAYVATNWSSATIPADLIARAHEHLPPGADGDVRIVRAIHAARLRRTAT